MIDEMKFEDALKELSAINDKMESPDLSLEDSVELFKKGLELTKFCQKKIEEARQEIMVIEE